MADDIWPDVDTLIQRLDHAARYDLGFPGARDFDYAELSGLLTGQLLNNVGDPWKDGVAVNQTKSVERRVVGFIADLFRAPFGDRWGYVTTGGHEGNLYGLLLARTLHPDTMVYVSRAAHSSVTKALDLLGMDRVAIRTTGSFYADSDVMSVADLMVQLQCHRHRPATIVATAGTTMAEAIDDVGEIRALLDELAIERRYIHVDAALSGIPLALLGPHARPGFDFVDGADSITVSGHKFLGSPFPCGVVVTRASHRGRVVRTAPGYTGSPDATIGGSRSGHAPLVLWHAIQRHGLDGLRRRAEDSRELARYTYERLSMLSWPAKRTELGFTVRLKTPPADVTDRWVLADGGGGWSHIVCMPGVTRDRVDAFLSDLADAAARLTPPIVPVQRHGEPLPATA